MLVEPSPSEPLPPSSIEPPPPSSSQPPPPSSELLPSSSATLPYEQLRELERAQRAEITSQHQELLRLRQQMQSSEAERLRLARIAASLTSERDQYLIGLREASERVNALRLAAERADAIHEQQRKEDTATFQANLQRLLSEKASLHEKSSSSPRSIGMEALVQANGPSSNRASHTRRRRYKQHREAAEQLQAGLAERDAAKLTAHHHKQQATKLHEQLAAAQKAIEMQSISVDALAGARCSKEVGDEAKRAAQRGDRRRLEAACSA